MSKENDLEAAARLECRSRNNDRRARKPADTERSGQVVSDPITRRKIPRPE